MTSDNNRQPERSIRRDTRHETYRIKERDNNHVRYDVVTECEEIDINDDDNNQNMENETD